MSDVVFPERPERHADAELFELFWENSKLNPATLPAFAARIGAFAAAPPWLPPLDYAGADHQLPLPDDAVMRAMRARQSRRAFSGRALSARQLGSLYAAFARSANGGRVFAAAGALYAVEVFGVQLAVEGELAGQVARYNADNHSLSVVRAAPPLAELAELIRLDDLETPPALLLVFALRARTLLAKYGERGGRFALIEVGQAVQNLALRLAHEQLAGVALGGFDDERLGQALGLPRDANVALVYACGHPLQASASATARAGAGRAWQRLWRRPPVNAAQ